MSEEDGGLLVARTASIARPILPEKDDLDIMLQLDAMTISEKCEKKRMEKEKPKKKHMFTGIISPVDFLNYQNAKSSFLAKKIRTAAKWHKIGPELFAELLRHTSSKKKSEETRSSEEDDKNEDELIPRGPSRISRAPVSHHPYSDAKNHSHGAAPRRNDNRDAYHPGYENNYAWMESPETVGYNSTNTSPGNCQDMGYFSASPSQQQPSPFPQCPLNELDRYLVSEVMEPKEQHEEVPKNVSDFILAYSRPYSASTSSDPGDPQDADPHSRNSSFSEGSDKVRRHSADSGCDSPMSAGSAPHCSPSGPRGTASGQSYFNENGNLLNNQDAAFYQLRLRAKDRFREVLTDQEYADGQLWALRIFSEFCDRNHSLDQKQQNGDTLFHIIMSHRDYGKIFALLELLVRSEMVYNMNPIDVRNENDETPLSKAVEYRCCAELVEYLLALGADANVQPLEAGEPIKDPPLHFAAAHSMPELVKVLCEKADVNMANGFGYTPLLCALSKHNRLISKQNHRRWDNSEAIKILLAYGADPRAYDPKKHGPLVEEIYERLEPEICEALRACICENPLYNMAEEIGNENKRTMPQLELQDHHPHLPQQYYHSNQYPNQGYDYASYSHQSYFFNQDQNSHN